MKTKLGIQGTGPIYQKGLVKDSVSSLAKSSSTRISDIDVGNIIILEEPQENCTPSEAAQYKLIDINCLNKLVRSLVCPL